MAKLDTPQPLFGRVASGKLNDPDADLIVEEASPESKGKGKEVEVVAAPAPSPVPRKQKAQRVTISLLEDDDSDGDEDEEDEQDGNGNFRGTLSNTRKKRKRVKIASPKFVPLEVPQEAESSRSTQQRDEENWEGLAFEDSDAELSV